LLVVMGGGSSSIVLPGWEVTESDMAPC
jgi:hypothetical protein